MAKTKGSLRRKRGTEFPPGWDEERVRAVIDYYDRHQDELLTMAEEELPEDERICLMEVPVRLVPVVREMIAFLENQSDEEAGADLERGFAELDGTRQRTDRDC